MLPGSIPDPDAVASWLSKVTIDGEVVDAVSWDVPRDMNHVPGQGESGAFQILRAKLTPVTAPDVIQGATSPWTRLAQWPPPQGTPVTIEVSSDSGVTWIPVITDGVTDTVSGSTAGDLSVDVIERAYRFTRITKSAPLHRRMPPATEGGAIRDMDLSIGWWIDKCFSRAGYQTTIVTLPGSALYASMQGSMWPLIGSLRLASAASGDIIASRVVTDWGWGFKNFTATWDVTGDGLTVCDLRVLADVPTGQVTYLLNGNTGSIGLLILTGGQAKLQVGGSVIAAVALDQVVSVRRNGDAWYLTSGTVQQTATHAYGGVVTGVTVTSTGDAVAGAVNLAEGTGHPTVPDAVFAPTAVIDSATHLSALDATPPVNASAQEQLDKLATATWSHWGFNEKGQAWWYSTLGRIGLNPVTGLPPIVRTISDDTDIIDRVSWSVDWQQSASQVIANYRQPYPRRSNNHGIDLWSDDSGQVKPGEGAVVELVHPDGDTDWIMPHEYNLVANGGGNVQGARAKARTGTMLVGLVDLPGDTTTGPQDRPANTSEYAASTQIVDYTTVKVTRQATSSVAVASQAGAGATMWGWLPRSLQGKAGTILRGMGVTTWADGTVTSADDGSDAPVFAFDAAEWLGAHGDLIVSWLADLMSGKRVNLNAMQIVPDPRLQLGDRVTLDLTMLGAQVTAVVTGKTLTHNGTDGLSMTVSLLATESQQTGGSWNALENRWQGQAWSDFESTKTGSDYADWEANPLD